MLINPTKLTRSPIATLLKLPALMAEHLDSAVVQVSVYISIRKAFLAYQWVVACGSGLDVSRSI